MISPALQLTARGCLLASGAALVTLWALAFRRRHGRHTFPQANLRSLQSFELVEVLKDEVRSSTMRKGYCIAYCPCMLRALCITYVNDLTLDSLLS